MNGSSAQLCVGIVGSGNIGSDLLVKLVRNPAIKVAGVAGIDPGSEGLALARDIGVTATHSGLEDLLERESEIDLVFDATSAAAHAAHAKLLLERGIRSVDLTPAALGPAVVPPVNLREHLNAPDVNLVTCGAQATVPIVAALARRSRVEYAEAVSTIASRSAGPGTRQNIDEFTFATARGLETVGGARYGKAIILLNPADPPITMRNTIYVETSEGEAGEMIAAVEDAVAEVARYVPGYRLAGEPLVADNVVTVLVEVEGAGDHLPSFAGNLDIMTSAAVRIAELYVEEAVPA